MKKLFISYCTEYEQGWGQRPDGFTLAEDSAIIKNDIEEKCRDESREIFWRYTEPEEVYCEDTDYDTIKKRFNENGIAYFNEREKLKFSLYKQIK